MPNLSKLFNFLTSRGILVIIAFVFILLFLRQCSQTANLEKEVRREHNNYLAQMDSVRTIKSKNGQLIQEKSAYQLKVNELSAEQKDLIKRLELKSNGRGNTPKAVIQTVGSIKDTSIRAETKIRRDPNGDESFVFSHEPQLPGKNKLKISGKTPYKLSLAKDPKDTTKYLASVSPGITSISMEQNIDIVTAIYQDPKSKRIMTRVTTDYPNLTFSEINSFEIVDNPETRKALKSARKEFGLGLQIGYGLSGFTGTMRPGAYIGFGLNYSPKFLQFGK